MWVFWLVGWLWCVGVWVWVCRKKNSGKVKAENPKRKSSASERDKQHTQKKRGLIQSLLKSTEHSVRSEPGERSERSIDIDGGRQDETRGEERTRRERDADTREKGRKKKHESKRAREKNEARQRGLELMTQ